MRQEDREFNGDLSYRVDLQVCLDYARPCLEKPRGEEERGGERKGHEKRGEGEREKRRQGEKRGGKDQVRTKKNVGSIK